MAFNVGMGRFTGFERQIRCARIFKVEEKQQAGQSTKQTIAGHNVYVKYTEVRPER